VAVVVKVVVEVVVVVVDEVNIVYGTVSGVMSQQIHENNDNW